MSASASKQPLASDPFDLEAGANGSAGSGGAGAFDPHFYMSAYPDVASSGTDPLVHYMTHGRAEHRYPSAARLDADHRAIMAGAAFDETLFVARYGAYADPVREFLLNYRHGPLRPNADFDADFVTGYYRRTLAPGENPFAFYCRHAHRPWCFASAERAAVLAETIARSPLFDAADFRDRHMAGFEHLSPELYYLTEGFRLLADPSANFCTASYLYDSPDIVLAQMNPLFHYELSGRGEGRPVIGVADIELVDGGMEFDPARRTLLFMGHQASRTGAPILALNLLERLGRRFNVMTLLLEGGLLIEDFRRLSCLTGVCGLRTGQIEAAIEAISRRHAIDCALLNTVVSVRGVEPLARRGVPVMTLVHDFAQYTRPLGHATRAVALSNQVLYPADLVREAAIEEIRGLLPTASSPANTMVRAQGRCLAPRSNGVQADEAAMAAALGRDQDASRLVVLGAGHIEQRKGVDLFIETARSVRDDLGVDCRFVWIGDGYEPATDATVSVYLQDQVRKSGLQDQVIFVRAQDNLDPWMEAADVFFMSSRLDPYPNVVLDALAHGLAVVCFDKATGAADLARDFPDRIRAAGYLRTREAAELIVEMAGAKKARRASKRLDRRLDFDAYADVVAATLESEALDTAREAARASELMEDAGLDLSRACASLPDWLVTPLSRVGPTRTELARLAARLEASGLPVIALSQARGLPAPAAELAWGREADQ